jgi:hypothetical protein
MLIDNIRKTLKCSLSLITLDTPLLSFAYPAVGVQQTGTIISLRLLSWAAVFTLRKNRSVVITFPCWTMPGKSRAKAGQKLGKK